MTSTQGDDFLSPARRSAPHVPNFFFSASYAAPTSCPEKTNSNSEPDRAHLPHPPHPTVLLGSLALFYLSLDPGRSSFNIEKPTHHRKSPDMASRPSYKVHSLKDQIANTKSSAKAGNKRRIATKKDPSANVAAIFGNNDDDEEDQNTDTDSSDEGGGSEFLRRLAAASATNGASAPKRRSKDDEIADSDDERKSSSAKKASDSKAAPAKAEPISTKSDDYSSSEAESDSEQANPNVSKTNGKATENNEASDSDSSTSSSGSTSDDDSDDNESEEDGADVKPAIKTAEKEDPAESDDESSTSSDSESDEDEAEEPAQAQPQGQSATNAPPTTETTSDSSDEESESESDSESDSDSDSEENQAVADESIHISDREDGSRQIAVPKTIAPDFMIRRSDQGLNGQDVAQVCNQANLEGKQLWYFTVPSNVPISVVQQLEIPIDQAQQRDPVFSHGGESYGLSFDRMTPKSTIQILIPASDGPTYQSCKSCCNSHSLILPLLTGTSSTSAR